MVGLILKRLITGEYGPLDRLLEFLVFVLILYEVIAGIRRHRRDKKRQRFLSQQREFVAPFITAGEELKVSLPGMTGTPWLTTEFGREADAWKQKVKAWTATTAQALGERSVRAGSAFMNVTDTSSSGGVAWKPDGTPWCFHEDVAPDFRKLVAQLDNLQRIVANPELYF
jgi:hypothetical protein